MSRSGASGGTIASFLAISENYSLGALRRCFRPYALSPIPGPRVKRPKTLRDYFLGYHVDPHLGILTKSLIDTTDRGIVHRSWGLQGGDAGYGPKFSFNEYTRVNSPVRAVIYSWGISVMLVALATSLFRSFVRSYSYAPGEGLPRSSTSTTACTTRAPLRPMTNRALLGLQSELCAISSLMAVPTTVRFSRPDDAVHV